MVFKNKEDFNFAASNYDESATMKINDLSCTFHMPKAVRSKVNYRIRLTQLNEDRKVLDQIFQTREEAERHADDLRGLEYKGVDVIEDEVKQGLPPHAARKAFKVDEYHCPTAWMHGSGLASSYFVPIRAEHGMWLDFNSNSHKDHHVAVLISVQGVNPLDGQSMVEGKLGMRQYRDKCPVHDVEFGGDRFCHKCGYKWVPQNYICTTGTPHGRLWLDGFLTEEGVVRQYYFTENESLGVAHQVIGSEKKVYSIGVAFYLSKNPKPKETHHYHDRYYGPHYMVDHTYGGYKTQHVNTNILRSVNRLGKLHSLGSSCDVDPQNIASGDCLTSFSGDESLLVKSLDVGAGAKIDQKIYPDAENLDFWREEPAGILYINYASEEVAASILKRGRKDLTKGGEGFLAGLKSGN